VVEPIQASGGDEGKVTRDLRAEGGMTLGIVKRTEEEFADWLGTEWGFAEGLLSYDDEPIALEQYQLNFLQNPLGSAGSRRAARSGSRSIAVSSFLVPRREAVRGGASWRPPPATW
jgi:hypothetical protein